LGGRGEGFMGRNDLCTGDGNGVIRKEMGAREDTWSSLTVGKGEGGRGFAGKGDGEGAARGGGNDLVRVPSFSRHALGVQR